MAEGKQTKQIIGQAFIQLCKEEEPMKISVGKIAEAAQIKRQTFYYHFPDKESLIRWIYQENAFSYLLSEDISLDNWEEVVLKMLKAMTSHQSFYRKTVLSNREILVEEFTKLVRPLFQKLFKQVDRQKQLSLQDIQFYSRFFTYGCTGILETWIVENFQESPLEIATQLFRLAKDVEFFSYQIYQKEL